MFTVYIGYKNLQYRYKRWGIETIQYQFVSLYPISTEWKLVNNRQTNVNEHNFTPGEFS